jgi:DNA-binding NarL/FixJ family response regulator
VRIVIADDAVLLREGVARVLGENGHEVVAQVGDADALRRAVSRFQPEMVIVDVRMPPTYTDEGTQAALALREEDPELRILVLSQIVEARHALRLFRETPEGFGYLLKDRVVELDDFLEAVNRVGRGGTAIDPEVVAQLLGRRADDDPLGELTPREREVLGLIAEGRSNKAICAKLFLSPKTIETHVNSIFLKLGLLPAPDDHRRVLAVLAYLRGTGSGEPVSAPS